MASEKQPSAQPSPGGTLPQQLATGRKPNQHSAETREKIVTAAINCICRDGFQRASTNRIATEAGLTWGVIQYHFGDKDKLLKAVLDHAFANYDNLFYEVEHLADQHDLHTRLEKLIELLWQEFNRPSYLASIEIIHNVNRDPNSRLDTFDYIRRWSASVDSAWKRLFPVTATSPAAKRILFATLRGFVDNRSAGQANSDYSDDFPILAATLAALLEDSEHG